MHEEFNPLSLQEARAAGALSWSWTNRRIWSPLYSKPYDCFLILRPRSKLLQIVSLGSPNWRTSLDRHLCANCDNVYLY